MVFFIMDYQKIYNNLITKRQNEILPKEIYGEKHHIIPKCLGGSNKKENLVRLTAREHYIAHLLLAKIHNSFGLYSAVIYMQTGRFENRKFKFNSRLYQKLREEFGQKISIINKGKNKGKNNPMYGKHPIPWNKGKKGLQVGWNKGKKMSEESRKKLSESCKGRPAWNKDKKLNPLSNETKDKISNTLKQMFWFNNGIISIRAKEQPEGFVKGRIYKRKSI